MENLTGIHFARLIALRHCFIPLESGRANIWAIIFTQRVSAGRHWVTEIIHKVIPALHDPGDTRVYVFKSFRIVKLTMFE